VATVTKFSFRLQKTRMGRRKPTTDKRVAWIYR
jgi:hypothetical protein